jgi:hypothetical protein
VGEERAEIEEAVGKDLATLGIRGTIALAGSSMELRAFDGSAPVSIDIDPIPGQWPLLPPEMRRRKSDEIARRLVGALSASRRAEGRRDTAGDDAARTRVIRAVAGLFALVVAIGAARFAIPRLLPEEKVEPKVPTESGGARADRLARACDAVRGRLYEGSSFGPFAMEGWVVELWLAGKQGARLRDQPALTGLVAGGKLLPAADASLAAIIDGTVEITDGFTPEAAQRAPGWVAASLVFREGYARAFLEEEHRPRFLALADRLVASTGADHAALYARCAHLTTHDIGAWFHGPDMAGAAAVMVYQMGFFAEGRVIDRGALGALHAAGDLDALRKATSDAGDAVGRTVSADGASVSTGSGTTLVFSLAAPARSLAATRDLARKMGIAGNAGE